MSIRYRFRSMGTVGVYREKMKLSTIYERNLDYMDASEQKQEPQQKMRTSKEKPEKTDD